MKFSLNMGLTVPFLRQLRHLNDTVRDTEADLQSGEAHTVDARGIVLIMRTRILREDSPERGEAVHGIL